MQNREHSHQRPADINHGLHDVGPDHRRQSAFKGINQRQQRNDRDGRDLSRAQRNRHDNRNGVNPHALRRRARKQKQSGSQRAQLRPKRRSINS